MGPIGGFLSAFGLSTAAGLNAYIPLLAMGVLTRLGYVQLNEPYSLLAHPIVLAIIALLAVLDFVGDKVPAVDHVLHAAGMVIHPIAGAVLFVAANSSTGSVNPVLAAICGLVLAGGAHAARATVRPVATTATGGTANPVLSLAEDAISLVLSILAIVIPVVAFVVVLILAITLFVVIRRTMGVWRRA
jgi:hypothetical protein